MNAVDLESFLKLRRHLIIAHHVKGRIRLRLKASIFTEKEKIDPKTIGSLLKQIEGIDDVRFNITGGSAVITYQPSKIKQGLWEELINGSSADAKLLLKQLIYTDID